MFQQFIFLLGLHFLFLLLPFSSAYTRPAEYFINCGSSSNFNGNDGRNFVGDRRSGVSFFVGQGSSTVQDTSPPDGLSQLYWSARTYRQPSFYEFMMKESGTYFVRLHFFISSSSNNLANAVFSVVASEFSLLSNFSVKNNPGLPVIKEFLVNVRVGRFRIHFVPTEGSNLAFINAIEVFLTPEKFIIDTAPLITPAAGRRNYFVHLQSQVLHTLHRINVGGPILTPESDTLWRNWIPDDSFLFNPRAARNSSFFSDEPKYKLGNATEYIAPSLVYRTAKEINVEESRKLNLSNITWSFNASKSSRHFVRLHFCDIVAPSFDSIVFNLSIYNKFVQRISSYEQTGQLETPFYFDCVVDSDESGTMNISVGPTSDSQDQNAFLNGIEIMEFMKKSDIVLPTEKPKSKRSNLFAIVGSVVGGTFVIILIVAVLVVSKCRKAKASQSSANMSPSNLNFALRIPYHEIEQSTKNFHSSLLIGEGGFGKVYEGLLNGKKVAVKRSEPGRGQGLLEFQTEIEVLSRIHHLHLVSLIGYCDEGLEMILVYEFMGKGTLRDNLYYSTPSVDKLCGARSELSWKQRLEICIGAAKGLNYLHTGSNGEIIHRDVKSTNILLDEQLVAKVADFGISKLVLPDVEHSVNVKGTFGYLDPEYFLSLQLTDKSDVYSFGVVLLEVLCARPAVIWSNRREEVNLAEWGMLWLRKGQLEKIIDPMLVDTINPNSLRKFGETAEKCLRPSGRERPIMRDVLYDLEYALQLQLTPMNGGPDEDSTTNASLEFTMPVLHPLPSNDEEDATVVLDDGSGVTSSQVFSTLRVGEAR
ncbi:putative receptor-like protein kinase [Hibiscus syriacus]|uniref:Receptor-like protein kinase n=1 Tax=Hibiscus syriacus TaxID=106335 RepID=A0A6A2ZP55_HIBSY|nr:probable receptor-like protein kinase At5g24010 [Hibiscus syriacus]KAE8693336.1 putative receptor-like protein kinase [Hibiscus syriacus]